MRFSPYRHQDSLLKEFRGRSIIDFTGGGYAPKSESQQQRAGSVCQIRDRDRANSPCFPPECQVLIVDDESAILKVTSLMMERLGYTALTLQSGIEATDYIRSGSSGVGFVMLDILLADTTGWRVYEVIRSVDLQLPVIFASGFANRAAMEIHLERDPYARFLAKPFGIGELRQLLACA